MYLYTYFYCNKQRELNYVLCIGSSMFENLYGTTVIEITMNIILIVLSIPILAIKGNTEVSADL